ncbi:aminotransferase class V-fold PLP-dependent enzyme [Luteimonas sp. TWI1437]|uniref:aminotransferase class V-fold PLP-dependent enzyme n=1 Tax=Luteimonas sp. TWI1437 TaxID=3136804 RepID=UPI0032089865
MADCTRRGLLRAPPRAPLAAALPAVAAAAAAPAVPVAPAGVDPDALARDEAYWARVAALHDVARDPVPLENGYWGVMAAPVQAAYLRHQQRVNREGPAFARRAFPALHRAALDSAADALGVGRDELALTRNATEALQALIGGYRRLRPGDAVLCADVDYDSMRDAMRWLRQRRGVDVIEIALPAPATRQGILDAYAQAIARHPRLRMMLLTQVSHRHGLRLPVAELCAMARMRGIDVILDAAHGVGQLDVRIADEGADFVGVNFHKWLGAPVGVGGLYIRRGRTDDVDPYMGQADPHGATAARVHTGTVNFAAVMALPDALAVHARIGAARKQARLRHLSARWLAVARDTGAFEVLASEDPALCSAIASLRLRGRPGLDDNHALAGRLLDDFGLHTVMRDGLASGACVRITPAVFTRPDEIDRLGEALRAIAATA